MKIEIIFEKEDIIGLVIKELEARGLKPNNPAAVVYKGALQVKLTVDVVETTTLTPPAVKSTAPTESTATEEEHDIDLNKLIRESNDMPKEPMRRLRKGESYEYPKD